MSMHQRNQDKALQCELLHSIAPKLVEQRNMTLPASSEPKISAIGVHFDGELSKQGEVRQSGMPIPIGSATPFSDGIAVKRSWFQHMPKRFALSMFWPLDVPGYNVARSEQGRGGGASLVYYRTFFDMARNCSSDWSAVFNVPPNAIPGETLFRVTCKQPCWITASKRYEAPIQVALGTDGPVMWEAWPTAPTNKRQDNSHWTLRCREDDFTCKIRTEDVLGRTFSLGDQMENVFTLNAKIETSITTQIRGGSPEVVYTDATADPTLVFFDMTHFKSGDGKRAVRNACSLAFLVAFLEASQAIRDEESDGTCKGRRDAFGRFIPVPVNGLKRVWNKILGA